MRSSKRLIVWSLVALVAILAAESPAQAYYGHRSYRSYRGGRSYNHFGSRQAALQRDGAALAMARARANAAQFNLFRQSRVACQQAEASPKVTSAKSDHAKVERDYQAARSKVIADLKANNAEFRELSQRCQNLRDKMAALAKSGDHADEIHTRGVELRALVRKATTIEERAVNADPTIKDLIQRQSDSHTAEMAAQKDALRSVAQNPAVQAAQKQSAQANQQYQVAASRYGSSLSSANSPSSFGGRSHGYRRYGWSPRFVHYSSYRSFRPAQHVHSVHPHVAQVHHPVRRHR